jgi:hypothetical protein
MSALKLTVTSWGEVAVDTREMKKLMRGASSEIRSKTARLINKTSGGGRVTHYRGDRHGSYRASMPGDPPVRASGDLRASLKAYVYKSGEGFAVRARQFYALFLEVGARGGGNPFGGRPAASAKWRALNRRKRAKGRYTRRVLEPRPFLDRVMEQSAPDLTARLRLAFDKSLTWKQTKGTPTTSGGPTTRK